MLKFYRAEIRFESELLTARLNALLSSQSFLVIAYATSMSSLEGHWGAEFTVLLPPCLALLALSRPTDRQLRHSPAQDPTM